jgi:cation diffusion facilitator family transporter
LAYIEGWLSIVLNVLLFIFKYWAGIVSGSVALLADAWHTLSDSISSVVVLLGARVSSKPPDHDHPFGHGRANLIAAIIIGVLLAVIGFNFLVESIHRLTGFKAAQYGTLAIVVTAISVVTKEFLARFSIWAGRQSSNQALIADGWHHRSDAISSVIVLAGILLGGRFWWVDGILGILVALLLFHAAYEVIHDATNPLLGETPDDETISKLEKLASQAAGQETHLHHVHIHRYGDHVEVTMHIRLPRATKLETAHNIATAIEQIVSEELKMEATIHMEPLLKQVQNQNGGQ